MRFAIEKITTFTLAYMRRIGEYGPVNISLMEDLKKWANECDLMGQDSILLSIPHDNPWITVPEECRYDVGIVFDKEITRDFEKDDFVFLSTYEPGFYAVLTISHTIEVIEYAWANVFEELMKAGLDIDMNKSAYERYW
jgi:DNA gyrase inhibitor GyrI